MRSNYAALASSFVVIVVGQSKFDNGLLNGTLCVALEEFEQCRTDVLNSLGSSCVNNAEPGSFCVCQKRAEMLNCFGSYCWNFVSDRLLHLLDTLINHKIYGCEYQETIRQFMLDCYPDPVTELESIPFWPAPSEGSGVCSCNFESMEQDLADVYSQYDACIDIRKNDPSKEDLDCYCCSTSRTVSM